MIEFMSPYEVMEKFVEIIEKERVRKGMTQSDLYKNAGISSTAYANFMSKKTTSFENIIKLLFALDMTSKINDLLKFEEFTSLDEIREANKNRIRKRVRKGKKDERD